MNNIGNEYSALIDKGAAMAFEAGQDDYKTRREESISTDKKYPVIMSPSRASFFLDYGDGLTVFQGECHRNAFLSMMKFPATNLPSIPSIRKMRFGQLFVAEEHRYEEKAGILVKKNYRMNKEITPNLLLSAEVDSIVKLGGKHYIAEIKSFDGYWAKRHVEGNKSRVGMPKYDHVAQNMLYLAIIVDTFPEVDSTIFHYRTRSEMFGTFHILELDKVTEH